MQLDRLGIGVVRIASRLEHFAENPLLAWLGEDLPGGQIVSTEGDPDADLVAGHDELRADLPRPVIGVVEIAALGQDPAIGPARLHALVVGPAIPGGRGQLHVGLELEPFAADQHGLLAGADVDLARIVNGQHEPQTQQEHAPKHHHSPRPVPGRQPSPG